MVQKVGLKSQFCSLYALWILRVGAFENTWQGVCGSATKILERSPMRGRRLEPGSSRAYARARSRSMCNMPTYL